jgi:hypothetical protein
MIELRVTPDQYNFVTAAYYVRRALYCCTGDTLMIVKDSIHPRRDTFESPRQVLEAFGMASSDHGECLQKP